MKDDIPVFAPCSEKQRLVLMDNEVDVLLVGGGAGGGKTRVCLTKYLPNISNKDFKGIVFRKTMPELKVAGGIVDESKKIYPWFKGVYKKQEMKWEFPNGAFLQFRGIPDDISSLQGMQATNIMIDEVAEWKEEDVIFLLSRMRSGEAGVGKRQCIMSCNPSIDSFLFKWVEWCLDPDTGIPKEGTEHQIRWFVNLAGKMHWADSREELIEKYSQGFITEGPDMNFFPKSFRFIPMTIYDNPVLLKNDPAYLGNLLSQSKINQLRYLKGSWTARADGAGYFKRDWIKLVNFPCANAMNRVRAWDLAASIPTTENPNPDWTVGVLISRDKLGEYYIEDINRFRKRTNDVIREIIETAKSDGISDVTVIIPKDPGQAGTQFFTYLKKTLAENGIIAKGVTASGHTSKLKRFLPFCSYAESGGVSVVKAAWNDDFFEEAEAFTGTSRSEKNDQCDAVGDGFNTLAKSLNIPLMQLADFSRPSILSGM